MKTLIAFLVAFLLPLQLSWGVAASYCQHEATVQGFNHFGHHSHVHTDVNADVKASAKVDTKADTKADAQVSAAKLMTDMDCGVCHASLLAMLPMWADMPAPYAAPCAPSSFCHPGASALQRTPDRPQWLRLA